MGRFIISTGAGFLNHQQYNLHLLTLVFQNPPVIPVVRIGVKGTPKGRAELRRLKTRRLQRMSRDGSQDQWLGSVGYKLNIPHL